MVILTLIIIATIDDTSLIAYIYGAGSKYMI